MESETCMEEHRRPLGLLTPWQQNGETAASLDFSKLTSSQFGITPDSFVAFPKDKEKSRVSQLKARRRSTIGVRGSPETNSLICFRAKQVMKTPPRTPQHLLESPLFSGRDSIKQKMAAFQRLMGTEEGEEAGHAQSGVDDGSEERENRLAPLTPPLSKRRRRGAPHCLWEEQIEEEPVSEIACSPERRAVESVMAPILRLHSQAQLLSLPMLSKPEMSDTEDLSTSIKKRVRFGAPLSPEVFDKALPPSTPLQKGATPAPLPSSTGRKHSLLKTPQRFEPPLPQPDFSSPEWAGASPVLTALTPCEGDEVFMDNQKISFPIMDEENANPPQDTKAHQPLAEHAEIIAAAAVATSQGDEQTPPSFTAAPHHPAGEIIAAVATSQGDEQTPPSFTAAPHHPAAEPVDQRQLADSAKSSTEAPRARGRKRKQPAESEATETRRSSRSAAKSAKGKLKTSSAKKRFGTKEVDRSLYGKRDYASKNPLLSPIMESTAPSLSSTPTPERTVTSTPATDENPASRPVPAPSANRNEAAPLAVTAELVAAAALWRRRFLREAKNDADPDTEMTDISERSDDQSEASVESSVSSAHKRASLITSAGRAAGGRRNSASRRRRSEPAAGEQKNEVCPSEAEESNQEKKPAGEASATEKLNRRKSVQKTPKRGSRSARAKTSSVSEQEERMEEQREAEMVCRDTVESSGSEREAVEKDYEEVRLIKGHEEHTMNHEDAAPPSVPSGTLESWQQPDFCIEDVLKPVAKTRGSVRRSLRHRRSVDVLAKGLAWVEHTSPQTVSTTQRRRTRGRLSAVSQPPSLPDSEQTPSERAPTEPQL